jgi:hypothetical protein
MKKMVRKYGRTLVKETLEEVAMEERVKYMHDVMGCKECFLILTVGICRTVLVVCTTLSTLPMFVLLGDECLCHRSNFAVEYL